MDFKTTELFDGRRIPILTIVDHLSRESLAIVVDGSLGGRRVLETLAMLALEREEAPDHSHGQRSRFISRALGQRAYLNGVELQFSRPGKLTDNGIAEALNGRLRAECMNENWFLSSL